MRIVRYGFDFCWCVDSAQFGALGDGDDGGLRTVLIAKSERFCGDVLRRDLSLMVGNGVELEAGHSFRSPTFVGMNVGQRATNHGTPARHHCGEREYVCTGSVEDRKHLSLWTKVLTNDLGEPGGVVVLTVGHLVTFVGLC